MFELLLKNLFLIFAFNFNNEFLFCSNFIILMNFLFNLFKLSYMDWMSLSFMFSMNNYSFMLILLNLFIFSKVIMCVKNEKKKKLCFYILMFMNIILLLNFVSLNIFMFYLMFEISLILIFYLLIMWGQGSLRIMASYYLMFYTLLFSLPMMIILFYLFNLFYSNLFFIMEMKMIYLNKFMFLILIFCFLVKLPMYLIHGWLLKAHVEAPVYGSMILAAIMLKLGSYGLLRMMFLLTLNFKLLSIYFMYLSILGSIILSMLCFRQIDMKILIAMSSIVHMNLLLSSMFSLMKISFLGIYMMMIAHGLCSSSLFYMMNLLYKKTNSRLLILNKGIINFIPSMTLMSFLLCSSNMSAPMSLNLISEIFMLISLINYLKIFMLFLFIYCLLSFMYSLFFFSFINHGKNLLIFKMKDFKMKNYFILFIHWILLNLMILNLNIFI